MLDGKGLSVHFIREDSLMMSCKFQVNHLVVLMGRVAVTVFIPLAIVQRVEDGVSCVGRRTA
jgi:hypothetical protein